MKYINLSVLTIILAFISCTPQNEPIVDSDEYAYVQGKSPKRGVSFSWQMSEDFDLLGSAVSWSYNWGNSPAATMEDKYQQYGIQYVPMCWNNNYSVNKINNYFSTHAGTNYLLGYNEPNLTDQANMTPTQAAERWGEVVELAKTNNAHLISPALNWGTLAGYHNGVQWLQEFFNLVNPDDIYGIAVHIYMNSAKATLGDLQRYKVFGKPLWLTEFCAWEGCNSSAAQCQFMAQCINSLEQDPDIERYAWFIPRWNQSTESAPYMQLITKTKPYRLTERGYLFINMSTFDKDAIYPCGKRIPAEHYRACSVDENYASPQIAIGTDVDGRLQIDGLALNQYMDYQVAMQSNVTTFQVRYTATRESQLTVCRVEEDGTETTISTLDLPKTKSKTDWQTIEAPIQATSGTQIIRVRCSQGLPRINWFKLK